jgi:aerobic C4-dicarboxylate transport protein
LDSLFQSGSWTTNSEPDVVIAIILGIDRFMSEARAITNMIGNAIATIVIAKSENEIDLIKAKEVIG